ncbi:MAG TPA: hydrogenase iron-sulfur subunit [Dehalococcoidales bacterium]
MVENFKVVSSITPEPVKIEQFKPKITVFHCFNAINSIADSDNVYCDIKGIKMPCSSITREVFLLRAFEAGADAVVVMVCPEGSCRYIEGNIWAGKRVARMKKLLDEIGLDGRRLNIFFIPQRDQTALNRAINQTMDNLVTLGPNPAA